MSFINEAQAKEIKLGDKRFSFLLSQINSPPKSIFVVGNEKILNDKSITVVGSRKMTEYGRGATERLVRDLVRKDFVIVSGLARGIDGVAHRNCLKFGGKTIAVLGHGFNRIYPRACKTPK